ncbi:hypothetical protein Tco_0984679 [Tanacetum coccineum]
MDPPAYLNLAHVSSPRVEMPPRVMTQSAGQPVAEPQEEEQLDECRGGCDGVLPLSQKYPTIAELISHYLSSSRQPKVVETKEG